MTEMSVSEHDRLNGWVAPYAQLIAKSTGGLDEMASAIGVKQPEADRMPYVLGPKSDATRLDAPGLGASTILRRSQQRDLGHEQGLTAMVKRAFTRRSQTSAPVRLNGENRGCAVKSRIPREEEDPGENARHETSQ